MSLGFIIRKFLTRLVILESQYHLGLQDIQWPARFIYVPCWKPFHRVTALARFMQLEVDPKEREKLAFRTHHGLWQFIRMPFGYKNGPSIFQRVMQNVLAPFL